MGTIFAIDAAAKNPGIVKVVVNLTYGSVADNVWTWWYLRFAKRRFQRLGVKMQDLERQLGSISPIPNASRLKSKAVLLYLSRRDRVLRYGQSRQFKDALDAAKVDYQYIENRHLGHIASIAVNLWRWRR
jgi:hypothetical protein